MNYFIENYLFLQTSVGFDLVELDDVGLKLDWVAHLFVFLTNTSKHVLVHDFDDMGSKAGLFLKSWNKTKPDNQKMF